MNCGGSVRLAVNVLSLIQAKGQTDASHGEILRAMPCPIHHDNPCSWRGRDRVDCTSTSTTLQWLHVATNLDG